jgi:hypothetical protein
MTQDAEKLKKNLEDAKRLVDALEIAKNPVPPVIKQLISAMQQGTEIGMSAEEASQYFAAFIKTMDKECGIGDPAVNQDDAFICLAKRDTTEGSLSYSGRLNFVLNPRNQDSVISIHWTKQKRSGWACVWDEIRNGSPTGLFRKCFIPEGGPGHLPKSAK